MANLGYTTRAQVEDFIGQTFPTISNASFDSYIAQAEAYINNLTGYNAATTTSGMLTEVINHEVVTGKLDSYNNVVVDLCHPPIQFDANRNPKITAMTFVFGAITVPLQLNDGTTNAYNSVVTVAENRKKVYYPSIYFFPAISTVTPTAKLNLFNLHDVRFWIDISYTGGYDTIPADITAAANIIVADLVLNRKNPQYAQSIRQGAYSVDFTAASANKGRMKLSPALERAGMYLQPYIRYVW